jgi:hypothetical protein
MTMDQNSLLIFKSRGLKEAPAEKKAPQEEQKKPVAVQKPTKPAVAAAQPQKQTPPPKMPQLPKAEEQKYPIQVIETPKPKQQIVKPVSQPAKPQEEKAAQQAPIDMIMQQKQTQKAPTENVTQPQPPHRLSVEERAEQLRRKLIAEQFAEQAVEKDTYKPVDRFANPASFATSPTEQQQPTAAKTSVYSKTMPIKQEEPQLAPKPAVVSQPATPVEQHPVQKEAQQPKPRPAEQAIVPKASKKPPLIPPPETEQQARYIPQKGTTMQNMQLSRAMAKNKTCALHPWREAYALCAYCHRAFCFEDIIEANKDYYCLEDVDNLPANYVEKTASYGNSASVIAGVLLMISFLVFFYFANANIIYILNSAVTSGIFTFIQQININYALALSEGALVLLGFISAILIMVQSKKGFYIGIFVCLASVTLFTYHYIESSTIYLAVVDMTMFVAFSLLLYSREKIAESTQETTLESQRGTQQEDIQKYSNVSQY